MLTLSLWLKSIHTPWKLIPKANSCCPLMGQDKYFTWTMPEIPMMDTLLLFHKWENYFKYYRKKQDCTFGCYWTWKMNYDCHIHVQDFSNYQSSSTSFHHPFHHPFSLPHLPMYVKGKMKLYTTSVHSAMVVSNSASLQISPQQWSLNLMLIPHKRI